MKDANARWCMAFSVVTFLAKSKNLMIGSEIDRIITSLKIS